MADTTVRVKMHHVSSINFPGGPVYDFMLRLGVEAVYASGIALMSRPTRWHRSGLLAASIAQERRSNQYGVTLSLTADAVNHRGEHYARYVHDGTHSPIFRPTGGFMPVGNTQNHIVGYSRFVKGQRANPFLKDGLNVAILKRARFGLRPVI